MIELSREKIRGSWYLLKLLSKDFIFNYVLFSQMILKLAYFKMDDWLSRSNNCFPSLLLFPESPNHEIAGMIGRHHYIFSRKSHRKGVKYWNDENRRSVSPKYTHCRTEKILILCLWKCETCFIDFTYKTAPFWVKPMYFSGVSGVSHVDHE